MLFRSAYNYIDIDWQEAAHGRAPALATGIKRCWPDRLPVNVNIVIGKHGATYGADTYGLVFHSHFLNDFGDELMHHTMTAARTIVHVIVIHERRLLADDILGTYYCFSIHLFKNVKVEELKN